MSRTSCIDVLIVVVEQRLNVGSAELLKVIGIILERTEARGAGLAKKGTVKGMAPANILC